MDTSEQISRLVARWREEDSPAVLIQAGITRMLDAAGHQALQGDLEAMAKPWEIFPATESLGDELPDAPGLYMFVWRPSFRFNLASGEEPTATAGTFPMILYVGQAGGGSENTIRKRYKDYRKHFRGNPEDLWTKQEPQLRHERLTLYFSLGPLEYWCTVVEDRARIEGLEKRLIRLFNPPLNDQHRPRLTAALGRPRPAWPTP